MEKGSSEPIRFERASDSVGERKREFVIELMLGSVVKGLVFENHYLL